MKRTTPETKTVSYCCNSTVSQVTDDDFTSVNIAEPDSLIMTVYFLCNQCGNICKVKEVPLIQEQKKFSIWDEIIKFLRF